jgi:hypothetical protein
MSMPLIALFVNQGNAPAEEAPDDWVASGSFWSIFEAGCTDLSIESASDAEPDGEESVVPAVPGAPYRLSVGAPRLVAPGAGTPYVISRDGAIEFCTSCANDPGPLLP